jgi:hypothetical protein
MYEKYVTKRSQVQVEKMPGTTPKSADLHKTAQGTRWFTQSQPDFTKDGPWTTTLVVGDDSGAFLKLTFTDHGSGGVHARWLNEKLLFVDVWLGRIVSIDLILNVEQATFIYSEEANYGQLVQPCKGK